MIICLCLCYICDKLTWIAYLKQLGRIFYRNSSLKQFTAFFEEFKANDTIKHDNEVSKKKGFKIRLAFVFF
ncbi:MAG: hypothetical protein ACTSO8_04410 [Promethearchaeota archaeon]